MFLVLKFVSYFFIGKFQMDVNMTYLAKTHFAGGVQSESGPNMSKVNWFVW